MLRQRICCNVVRLDKRRVKKIAQRNCVARLKTNVVFQSPCKRLLRNCNYLIEVARFSFRPIEYDARGRDFRETANLEFLSRLLLCQNVAGLCIGNNIGLRRNNWGNNSGIRKTREKKAEKSRRRAHK